MTNVNIDVVQNQRTGLIRFLVSLVMVFQGIILYLSWTQGQGVAVPALAVVGSLACLYVIARERRLRLLHDSLTQEVLKRRGQVQDLGRRVQVGEGRIKEVNQLHQAISAVSSMRDPIHVFDAVVKAALGLVGADCGTLMILDEEGIDPRLRFRCTRGVEEGVASLTLPLGVGLAGRVAEEVRPVLLSDAEARERYLDNAISERAEKNLAMAVPVLVDGTVVGVLGVGSANEEKRDQFTADHLRTVNVFAQHVSMAIQYAQLKESAEKSVRQGTRRTDPPRRSTVTVL